MNILKILLDYLRWHFFSLSSVSYVFMNAEKKNDSKISFNMEGR